MRSATRPRVRAAAHIPRWPAIREVNAVDSAALIQTVLNGRTGPITVNGKQYGGNMPSWRGQLSDAEVAAVLTYVRTAWHNDAPAVSEDQVAAARAPEALSGPALFAAKCATCHQPSGQGTETYPPLAGNPVVTAADPSAMIAVIVNGRTGPLSVNGKTFQQPNADLERATLRRGHCDGRNVRSVGLGKQCFAGHRRTSRRRRLTRLGTSRGVDLCEELFRLSRANGAGGIGPALAGNPHVNISDPTKMLSTILRGRNQMPSWRGQLRQATSQRSQRLCARRGATTPRR